MIESLTKPRVRFSYYDNIWHVSLLTELGISVVDGDRGKNYPNGTDFSRQGYCLFLNAKNVTKTGFCFDDVSFISEAKDRALRKGKLVRNDIVVTTRGTVGNIAFYDDSVCYDNMRINSGMVLLRNSSQVIDCRFLYIYLASSKVQQLISSIAFGSAQPQLTVKEILRFKISYPSFLEQQKIAAFLTAVDDKILQLSKKKTLLEQYKKGSMQQIFSQEIRFKDENGDDYPEWRVSKLGSIALITTGSSNRVDSNLDGKFTFFDRSQDVRLSDRYLFDAEAIIVPGEGQAFVPKHFKGKFDLHQRTYAIMDFNPHNGRFLYYSMTYNSDHLNSHAVGSTVKSLRLPMFQKMPIALPPLEEQTKIANFLSALDDKIKQVDKQLKLTNQYKKGLLQQMFV